MIICMLESCRAAKHTKRAFQQYRPQRTCSIRLRPRPRPRGFRQPFCYSASDMTYRLSRYLMLGALALLWLPAIAFGWNAVFKPQWKSKPLDGVQKMTDVAALTSGNLNSGAFQR